MLRGVFAAMFLAQVGVAAALASGLALLAPVQTSASPLTAQILVVLALVDLPVAATLPYLGARGGGKSAALAATLLAGVLLATPAWFLAFAALVKSGAVYLLLLLAVVLNAYALGFFLCGRFAGFAVVATPGSAKGRVTKQAQR